MTESKPARLPKHLRIAASIAKATQRLVVHGKAMAGWGIAESSEIVEAASRLDDARKALEAKGADWRPPTVRAPKVGGAKAPLTAGALVTIREKVSSAYDGILDGDERNLTVDSERGKKVFCLTPSGAKVLLDRAHLAARA